MRIAIVGADGRMGRAIQEIARNDKDIEIAGLFECDENCLNNSNISMIKPISKMEVVIHKTDVLIDFTNPESSLKSIEIAKKHKVAIVIGTTGFTEKQKEKIADTAKTIPIILSPNMSVGVNILFELVKDITKKIPDYDIEIVELHHNKKKDAPSGTAAKLADIAARATGKNINEIGVYGRNGIIGERKKEEIGVMSVRAGDITGDHTIYFAGPGERIELTHRAHSRDSFASGAIRAAKWLFSKPSGLYDMTDVLSLKKI
jgi:4-hydroxy-tetrahydrodipicolinate reductase